MIDARAGARYTLSTNQYMLLPQEQYTRYDTEYKLGPRSRYAALEAEVSGSVPAPGGSIFAVATGYAILGTPAPYYIFEDTLKVIVAPPYIYRFRAGYIAQPTREGTLKVGGTAELIGIPGRNTFVVRAGPALNVALTHHLDAVGALTVVIASPDSLGLVGADLATLGLRYRWATGDRWPDFP
jgi:hypothetical protein